MRALTRIGRKIRRYSRGRVAVPAADRAVVLPRPLRRPVRFFHALIDERIAIPRHLGSYAATGLIGLTLAYGVVVGGHLDGTTFASAFALDLIPLQELFDPLREHYWQALSMATDDELGPHVGIVGDHLGHRVAVRILAAAPDRFESGRFANVYEARLDDAW